MAERRKPVSFDTTLRNPSRIPQFISVLSQFEGKMLDDKVALELEGEIIRQKIFEPTKNTLGKYVKNYNIKFHFVAEDQSTNAAQKVEEMDFSSESFIIIDYRLAVKLLFSLSNSSLFITRESDCSFQ